MEYEEFIKELDKQILLNLMYFSTTEINVLILFKTRLKEIDFEVWQDGTSD